MNRNINIDTSEHNTSAKFNYEDGFATNKKKTDTFISELRPVKEVPTEYQSIFSDYTYFNVIQSSVIDTALYTDKSMVVSAPTGSGKTIIFELAIVRYLMNLKKYQQAKAHKIVYIAPMKALCEERLKDWHCKFSSFGITIMCVTGDSDQADVHSLLHHDLIISTPEKWDSITRRWQDNQKLAFLVKLFMVDEVHLLHEENRGPTLEVVISRMKTIQNLKPISENVEDPGSGIRFVTVSATIPNVDDFASWLSLPKCPAQAFMFGEETRPVKLNKVVQAYRYDSQNSTPFRFELILNYKLQNIMMQYAEGKPTLIFCSTRKSAEMTSQHITQNITIDLNTEQKQILCNIASSLSESKLKVMLVNGVCYHHAGLTLQDRSNIEMLFRDGNLPVLVTTSTLAMGVNLPAHLVIIKSTKHYCNGQYQDYSESMLYQMIGRAGRPQYDTSATAVILTSMSDKYKYENMVSGKQKVESNLHKHLAEHVNSEIVLRTITDLGVAMEWLSSTFLHIRARKNPQYYGLSADLNPDQIDKKLLDICQISINRLARAGMITIDQNDVIISPTMSGCLMAKYCVAFETMQLFTQVTGQEILQQMLSLIAKCREFSNIYLRVNDKKTLNLLNKCRNGITIRFPFNGKISTVDMKINCIIQAVFGCIEINEQSLITESLGIMRIGERISTCLAEFLQTKSNCYLALLSALILVKCFRTRLWENSPFISKQLSGIGNVYSSSLVNANKISFQDLLDSNPRDLERFIHRKPPMGNTIQDEIKHLPQYDLSFEKAIINNQIVLNLKIVLCNSEVLKSYSTANVNSSINLLVGDTRNDIFIYEKYTHNYFIQNSVVLKSVYLPKEYKEKISAHLISEDWVGIDKQIDINFAATDVKDVAKTIQPGNVTEKSTVRENKKKNMKKIDNKDSHIQTFISSYYGKTKHENKSSNQVQRNKLKTSEPYSKQPKMDSSEKVKLNTISNNNVNSKVVNCTSTNVEKESFKFHTQQTLQEIVHDSIQQYSHTNDSNSQNIIQKPNLVSHQISEMLKIETAQETLPTRSFIHKKSIIKDTFCSFKKIKLMTNMDKDLSYSKKDNLEYAKSVVSLFKNEPPSKFITSSISYSSENELLKQDQELSQKNNDNYVASNSVHKSIRWHSPLVVSSHIKHSPMIDNHTHDETINIFLNDLNNSDSSGSQLNAWEKPCNNLNQKSLIYKSHNRSTLRQSLLTTKKNILPLSDQASSQMQMPVTIGNESMNLEANKDDTLASTTFLESLGILSNNEQNKLNCSSNDVPESQEKMKRRFVVTEHYTPLPLEISEKINEEIELDCEIIQNGSSVASNTSTLTSMENQSKEKQLTEVKSSHIVDKASSLQNNSSTDDLFGISDIDYINETNIFESNSGNSRGNFMYSKLSTSRNFPYETHPSDNKENITLNQCNKYSTKAVSQSQFLNYRNTVNVEPYNERQMNFNTHDSIIRRPVNYSSLLIPRNETEISPNNISPNFHSQPVYLNNYPQLPNNGIELLRPMSQMIYCNCSISNESLQLRNFEEYGSLPIPNMHSYSCVPNLNNNFCSSSGTRERFPTDRLGNLNSRNCISTLHPHANSRMRCNEYAYQNNLEFEQFTPGTQNLKQEYSGNFLHIRHSHREEQYHPNYCYDYEGEQYLQRNPYY